MIQIDNTLVSLDVLERQFLCDLSHCKGICCVEGDSGAPLLEEEVGELEKALPVIWDDLAPKAQEIIKKQGVAYIDEEGDLVTSIVNGKDCVFTCYDGLCGAFHRAGRTELASVRWRRLIAKVSSLSINRFPATFTRYVWKSTIRSKRLITIAGVSAKPQRYWVRKKNSRSISF